MKVFPFSLQDIIRLSVVAAAPMLPLLPLVMPIEDILKMLGKALL
jgi:hypothetical protein